MSKSLISRTIITLASASEICRRSDLPNLAVALESLRDEWNEKQTNGDVKRLAPRLRNALLRIGVYNLSDLSDKTEGDFKRIKNFGRVTMNQLREIMVRQGISFRS